MTIPTGPGAAQGHNLLGPPPTRLPETPEPAGRLHAGEDPAVVVADHPTYSAAWAALAERAEAAGDPVTAYAFARTGYHRGLDQLRRHGWKGFGPVPWDHPANQGFLRSVAALARAAGAIGERDELDRCTQLVADSDPAALEVLGLAPR